MAEGSAVTSSSIGDSMSDNDIKNHLAHYAQHYPSLISVEQAAEIAQVSVKTIYHWSSMGQLNECKKRCGKRLRISRDCLVLFLLSGGSAAEKRVA